MSKSGYNGINRNFADKVTPEAKEAFLKVNEPREAELLKQGKDRAGEGGLRSTLELIQKELRQRSGSDEIFENFIQNKAEIDKIKAQLLENISSGQGDRRETIVREVVEKLIDQPIDHSLAA